MTRNPRQSPSETASEPGADRFWGQFSQAGRGREEAGDSDPGDQREPEAEATGGPRPGSAGPAGDHAGPAGECLEWCPICRSAELIRTAVTPELREQAENLQREAVQIFQAFVAAYSERTGQTGAGGDPPAADRREPSRPTRNEGPPVTDIPLD